MAKVIGIMGESGSGKTTSMRNLDPKTTMYIDCDKKGLPWKGWRKQYNNDKKAGKINYWVTDSFAVVSGIMNHINDDENYKHIK